MLLFLACIILLLLLFLLWALRLLLFQGPALPPSPLPDGKIIDIHCHCAGIGGGDSNCFVSPGMLRNFRSPFLFRGFQTSKKELREQGDVLCLEKIEAWLNQSVFVDGAVVLAMDAIYGADGKMDREGTIFYVPNQFVAGFAAHSEKIYFGASVHPNRPGALERLKWCKEAGAVLLKWLPAIQLMDPSEPRFHSFYSKLIELDLPLLCHVGDESTFHWAANEMSNPALLELPLEMGVRVIAAHIGCAGRSGGQDNFQRTVAMMEKFPNLWADISALSLINRKHFLQRALQLEKIHDRLLFGTDYPLNNMPVVSPYYFPLRLTWRQMRSIASMSNPWDRDVAIKQSLGVPAGVFAAPQEFLRIDPKV
jgi:predicted TIM-barrel fold metal-dependent hydrolase